MDVRAKSAYIKTKRRTKDGRIVAAKDHMQVSAGMHSAKEMEKFMVEYADAVGADHSQIVVEAYQNGEAPITANPRHRGYVSQNVFTGWTPMSEEEIDRWYAERGRKRD